MFTEGTKLKLTLVGGLVLSPRGNEIESGARDYLNLYEIRAKRNLKITITRTAYRLSHPALPLRMHKS